MMLLIVSKISVLILFGLLKFFTGLAPSLILKRLKVHGKRKIWLEKAMGGVLCVGGGVLFATVWVHMLPEVRESFDTAKKQFQENEGHHEHHDNEHHDHEDHDHEDHDHAHDKDDSHRNYPYAELVICAGFFVIYFVEAVVHRIFIGVHGGSEGSHGHSHAIPPGMIKSKLDDNRDTLDENNDSGASDQEKCGISSPNSTDSGVHNPTFRIESEGLNGDSNEITKDGMSGTKRDGNDNMNNTGGIKLTSPTNTISQSEHPDSAVWNKSHFSKKYKTQSTDTTDGTALGGLGGRSNVYNVSSATLTSYTSYNNDGGDHSLEEASLPNHYGLPAVDTDIKDKANTDRERKVLFSVRSILIVLALSVHSVFEGMAIGLQLSVPDVWKLFLAVALHDVPVHFCVGMEMFNNCIRKLHIIVYFLILSIINSVGIIIGILVTEHAGEGRDVTQTLVIGVLQGLAGGTLLYITFYEVLDREKLSKAGMTGMLGCFLIACGFAFMALMETAGGHSHGVVQKNDHDTSHSEGRNFMKNNHGHSHGNERQEQAFSTLNSAIDKYGGDIHDHDHGDDHHSDEHNQIDKRAEAFSSGSLDLESEIKSLYSNIENDYDLGDNHDHSDDERIGNSHDHHGELHEEHNHEEHSHVHVGDDSHEHDDHKNETETSNELTKNSLHESMFLTLQNGK